MKRSLYFSPKAKKQFLKLDAKTQQRIKRKLEYYLNSDNPLKYAKKLINSSLGMYRFRIWDYRIFFDVDEEGKIIILLFLAHRKDIYEMI